MRGGYPVGARELRPRLVVPGYDQRMTLFLLACTGDPPKQDTALVGLDDTGETTTDTGDTAPPEDLGDPYLAMVAATPPDYLLSTCQMRVDVYIDGKAVDGASLAATGGEWVGIQLSGDEQYTASGVYEECTKLNPTGTVESGAFSGVAGYLFLFWYSGADQGLGMVQVLEGANYRKMTIQDPQSGLPIDLVISDNCGNVSITARAVAKVVALPSDLFASGDNMAGVNFFAEGVCND